MMIYNDIMHFEIMFSRTVTTDQTIEAILFTPVSEDLHRGIGWIPGVGVVRGWSCFS